MKIEECAEIGIRSFDEHLSGDATQREIEEIVDRFNADERVHSILVQLPLPEGVNEEEVLLRVLPSKTWTVCIRRTWVASSWDRPVPSLHAQRDR